VSYHIHTLELAEQPTAVVRASMPAAHLPGWLPVVYHEVTAHLAAVGVPAAGPPFARFSFHDDLVDAEAGFPVPHVVAGAGRITPASLPAGPVALTTHLGRYESLTGAYDAVAAWLKERGLEPAGPHWEVYYTDPQTEPDPTRWRTDIVAPYQAD
jgi:effector-binding domain-containing protein